MRSGFLPRHTVFLLFVSICLLTNAFSAEPPAIYDSEKSTEQPISGQEAVAKIQLPAGFKATLFATEPTVRNPIALQYDTNGRLWVAENFSYAESGLRLDPNLNDKIVIFEDQNRDGSADKTTVFSDQLHNLTGFALGHGGVWAICPPQLLFIADSNHDDRPDGPPVVVLDGFWMPTENHHNFANGLKFGPDGWLYGRAGGSSPSEIGRPGTPLEQRVPLRGGIWRVHPKTHQFEALTHGTTNPWGMDWDAHGELFFVNTVNGHLWHLMPGAHLMRLHTIDPNPNVYQMIDTIADHYHFDTGQGWTSSRDGAANHLGGGHAHQGGIIYQGGVWPKVYDGRLFTVNFHGRRINTERLTLTDSGYVGSHEKDLALFGDKWFRGIDMAHSPDGNMTVIDWSDTGECHENTGVHRSSGRIYLLQYGSAKPAAIEPFQKKNLIAELKSTNIFYARRALQAVADAPANFNSEITAIEKLMTPTNDAIHRLRGIWALYSMGELSEQRCIELTRDHDAHVRTWAVRLLVDNQGIDTIFSDRRAVDQHPMSENTIQALLKMAETETSALVKQALASAIQRMPVNHNRAQLAATLARNGSASANVDTTKDTTSNATILPLLVWYGLIPIAEKSPAELVDVLKSSKWTLLDQQIARSLSALTVAGEINAPLNQMIDWSSTQSLPKRQAILAGMNEGLAGRDRALKPDSWTRFIQDLDPDQTASLNALFGEGISIDKIKAIVADSKADMHLRQTALKTLIQRKPADIISICRGLLGTRFLNTEALAGLRGETDPAIADSLINNYRSFALLDRPKVVDLLTQRPEWALVLLKSVESNRFAKEEISVIHARQMMALNRPEVSEMLKKNWGEIKSQSAAKKAFSEQLRNEMKSSRRDAIDFSVARQTYLKSCGQCHMLYGEGGRIGPDITGAQRQNLDYLLENITDPSAAFSPDFRLTNLEMKDGRIISGLVRPRDKQAITLITTTETMIIPRDLIETQQTSTQSIMPEGLLEAMSHQERTALLHYLMTEGPPQLKSSN